MLLFVWGVTFAFTVQQLQGGRSPRQFFFVKKKVSWFERQGFGRGGEISSFLGELGLQLGARRNLDDLYYFFESLELPNDNLVFAQVTISYCQYWKS